MPVLTRRRIFGIQTRYVFGFAGGSAFVAAVLVYGVVKGVPLLGLLLVLGIAVVVCPISVFGTSWLIDRWKPEWRDDQR